MAARPCCTTAATYSKVPQHPHLPRQASCPPYRESRPYRRGSFFCAQGGPGQTQAVPPPTLFAVCFGEGESLALLSMPVRLLCRLERIRMEIVSDFPADAALTLRKKRGFSVCSVAGSRSRDYQSNPHFQCGIALLGRRCRTRGGKSGPALGDRFHFSKIIQTVPAGKFYPPAKISRRGHPPKPASVKKMDGIFFPKK